MNSPRLLCAIAALLVVTATALSGCDLFGDDPPPVLVEPPSNPLVPLAVGNSWSYSLSYGDPAKTDSFTMQIEEEIMVEVDGKIYRAFARATRPKDRIPRPGRTLMANAPDGLHLVGGFVGSDTLFFDSLFRTYPADVGASWPSVRLAWVTRPDDLTYVADTLTQTLVAIDEVIETPAGTFTCHVYKYSFRPAPDVASMWDVYDYYAPGIGRVAEIVEDYGIRNPDDRRTIQVALLYKHDIN